jgi:hypothetical protein
MPFEGYERGLCKNGHLNIWETFFSINKKRSIKCSACNEYIVWYEVVSPNDYKIVALEKNEKAHKCTCLKCGNKHSTTTTYKIPKTYGTTVAA